MNPITDKYKTMLDGKLLTYASLLDFRYKCLCVKTSPEALLPIEVSTSEGDMPLEKIAKIGIMDDEHYLIAPLSQDMLTPICKAFLSRYPQLKQELKDLNLSENIDPETRDEYEATKMILKQQTGEDLPPIRVLELTTPEVDDDMKKQLDQSVDALKQMCKAKFQTELANCKAETSRALARDPQELQKANNELDIIYNKDWNIVEHYSQKEKEDIADANNRYNQRKLEKLKEKDPLAGMSENDRKAAYTYNPNNPIEE